MNQKNRNLQRMNIVSASSVSLAKAAFDTLGQLDIRPETDISPETIAHAHAVITRSKTALTPALFEGSAVKFAGTCTAGIDHADPEGLADMGISFHSAPGCNANGVAEYVVAALLHANQTKGWTLEGRTVGIVGHGQVGTRVEAKAKALGFEVLLNDPPEAESAGAPQVNFHDLHAILPSLDVLTLHVPLVEDGPHPTRRLIGAKELALLKPGCILINACRGEVIDPAALRNYATAGHFAHLVLDVWDEEPQVDERLLALCDLASCHIAGHSVEGKVNGTRQIREQLCEHFGFDSFWDPTPFMPAPTNPTIELPQGEMWERLFHAVTCAYDIQEDDRLLRQPTADRAALFKTLRRNYRDRREFDAHTIVGATAIETPIYQALGFHVQENGL